MNELKMRITGWWKGDVFNATFAITNRGATDIPAGWTLTWGVSGPYAWNLTALYYEGITFSQDPVTGNDTVQGNVVIPAGGRVKFEFQAKMASIPPDHFEIPNPENALLNGEALELRPHNVFDLLMGVSNWQGTTFDGSFAITNRDTVELASGWTLEWKTKGTYAWKITGLATANATFTRDDVAGKQYITGNFPIPAGASVTLDFAAELPSAPPHDAWIPDPESVKLDKGLLRIFERQRPLFPGLGMTMAGWWGGVFNALLTIRNEGPKNIPAGWDLTLDVPVPYSWQIGTVYDPNTTVSVNAAGNDVVTCGFDLPAGESRTLEFQGHLDTTPTEEPLIPDPAAAALNGYAATLYPRNKQTIAMKVTAWQTTTFNATYTISNENAVDVASGWTLTWDVAGPYAWSVLQVYDSGFTLKKNVYGNDTITGDLPIPPGGSVTFEFQAEMPTAPPAESWIPDPELVSLNGAGARLVQREVMAKPSVDRTSLPVSTAPGAKRFTGYYGDWSPGTDQYFPWDIPAEKFTHVVFSFLSPAIHFPEYGTAGTYQVTTPDGRTGSLYDLLLAESPDETVKGVLREGIHGPLASTWEERWKQDAWWLPRPTDADLTGRLAEASAGVWFLDHVLLWNKRFRGAAAAGYGENEPLPPYGADEPVSGFSPSGSGGGPSPEHAMGNYRHLFGLRDGVRRWEEDPQAPGTYRYVEVAAARNPNLRILLSIGGWDLSEMFSVLCNDARLRGQFADQAIAFMQRWKFDGIDIDWEHPGSFRWKDGISGRKEDRLAFHRLLQELRSKLDALGNNPRTGAPYELTAAVSTAKVQMDSLHDGSVEDNDELTANGLQPWWTYLGAVDLMTYDTFGPWERLTHHHTGLFPDIHYPRQLTSKDTDVMRSYRSIHGIVTHCRSLGMPSDRINVGGAFYGRGVWGVADPGEHHAGVGDGGLYETHLAFAYDDDVDPGAALDRLPPGTFSWSRSGTGAKSMYEFWDIDQHYRGPVDPVLESKTASGSTVAHGTEYFERPFQRFWDERACTPWLFSRAKGRGWFISYDDPESLGWKADYAWAQNLGGVFFWMLAGDDGGVARTRSRRARGRHQLVRAYWAHLRLGEIVSLELWATALIDDYFTSAGEWLDRSRHGRTLGVVGTVPARVSNAINNKGVVRFDGAGRYVPTLACMPAGAFTVVAVFSGTGTVLGSDGSDGLRVRADASIVEVSLGGVVVMQAGRPAGPLYTEVRSDGAGVMRLSINGAEAASGAASGANANTSLIIGSHGGGVDPFQGDVAEVLVFSQDLVPGSGAAEVLREYLLARYHYDVSQSMVVHGPEGLVVLPKPGTGIVSPVEAPAHCGLLKSGDGGVSVPITFIPVDYEARADYAVGSTAPDPGSSAWTYFGRTAVEATLSTPALPAGSTVWIRLRSERQGYASSAWTTPESIQL